MRALALWALLSLVGCGGDGPKVEEQPAPPAVKGWTLVGDGLERLRDDERNVTCYRTAVWGYQSGGPAMSCIYGLGGK